MRSESAPPYLLSPARERALADLPDEASGALDATQRGVVQLEATVAAFASALGTGKGPPTFIPARQALASVAQAKFQRASALLAGPLVTPKQIAEATRLVEAARHLLAVADRLGRPSE